MTILKKLEKSKQFWILLFISLFFFFLRFPSMFEPYWYGDEGIYQALGLGIDHGRTLYRDIFDNKPPFLYILYSLFNSDQFLLRLVSLIFGILSTIALFFLSKKITNNNKVSYIASFTFALFFGLPLIEGNIANAENFMLFFNIVAGFLIIKSLEIVNETKRIRLLFFAGILLSISFLFKIVALFDFAAFFLFLFFANFSDNFKYIFKLENLSKEIKNLTPLIVGFVSPIIIVALYFVFSNAFPYFLKATFFNNIGYVGYGNKLIIPQGLLIVKLILLLGASVFIFAKRKVLGNASFVYLWVFFSLFNAFFSQRPYTHYVLVVLPSLCLLLALVLLKNKYLKFNLLIFIASIILLVTQFSFYVKTIFYYQNFVLFLSGQKNVSQYQRFFDGNTPNDYEIASYVNSNLKENDKLFIWGNNAQVYKLTNKLPPGRYTVAYHITNYEDGYENTLEGLVNNDPKFIILMPNVTTYPFSLVNYYQKININGINIYERAFK